MRNEEAACAMLVAYALYHGIPLEEPKSITPNQRKRLEQKWRELSAPATQQ